MWFMPMANMWWTQTPMPTTPVRTVDAATHGYATMGRRANTGKSIEIIPVAGRKTM